MKQFRWILFAFLVCACQSAPKNVLIIGHRGASGLRPEHTRASYELAIEEGADFIEPDVIATKDGVLIVRHENEISATTDAAEKFPDRKTKKTVDGQTLEGWFAEDFTLAEIKTLRAKERLPTREQKFNGLYEVLTLDEVIDVAVQHSTEKHTVGLYIETKHPSYFRKLGLPLEEKLAQSLKQKGLAGPRAKVFIQSFELSSLQMLRPLVDSRLVFLVDEPQVRPADFVAKGDPRTYGDLMTPAGLAEIAKVAQGIGPWKRLILPANASGHLLAPTNLVKNAHAAGLFVHAYTFRSDPSFLAPEYAGDPSLEYRQFEDLGVDGFFTDFPGDAVRARTRH